MGDDAIAMVTRFTHQTWAEFRAQWGPPARTALYYNCPRQISPKQIDPPPMVGGPSGRALVVEMNISTNQIMGVGEIRLDAPPQPYPPLVYGSMRYNLYGYRIERRADVDASALGAEDLVLLRRLEARLFRGKGHVKRGNGIQAKRDFSRDAAVLGLLERIVASPV